MAASPEFSISVVIPTLNREGMIGDAIRSVLNQSESVAEILVVDGGSTDGTKEVAESFGPLVRFMPQEGRWASGARNTGMRAAKGNWIALLDSDDLWMPTKLREQKIFLTAHPEIEFVFADMAIMEDERESTEPEILNPEVHDYLAKNSARLERFLDCLLRVNFVPTSSVLFQKDVLPRVGLMDDTAKHCEDYDFWLRFAMHCRCGFINQVLVQRRMHEGNLMLGAYVENCEATIRLLQRLETALPRAEKRTHEILKEALALTRYRLGSFHFKQREFQKARECFSAMRRESLLPKGFERAKFLIKNAASALLGARC